MTTDTYTHYRTIGETLDQLRLHIARRNQARDRYDGHRTAVRNLIDDAHKQGATMGAIANATGLTRQRVGQILGDSK